MLTETLGDYSSTVARMLGWPRGATSPTSTPRATRRPTRPCPRENQRRVPSTPRRGWFVGWDGCYVSSGRSTLRPRRQCDLARRHSYLYPRGSRGGAATRPLGISACPPRRRRGPYVRAAARDARVARADGSEPPPAALLRHPLEARVRRVEPLGVLELDEAAVRHRVLVVRRLELTPREADARAHRDVQERERLARDLRRRNVAETAEPASSTAARRTGQSEGRRNGGGALSGTRGDAASSKAARRPSARTIRRSSIAPRVRSALEISTLRPAAAPRSAPEPLARPRGRERTMTTSPPLLQISKQSADGRADASSALAGTFTNRTTHWLSLSGAAPGSRYGRQRVGDDDESASTAAANAAAASMVRARMVR
mmetsp:Transcript_18137/g.56633  ORF Transcript_18137/g.56633 Transcript_18137/m.56633 type:complete len:372 (+) Transcript_18137:597-1712(+)